jgi:hypothetical protein
MKLLSILVIFTLLSFSFAAVMDSASYTVDSTFQSLGFVSFQPAILNGTCTNVTVNVTGICSGSGGGGGTTLIYVNQTQNGTQLLGSGLQALSIFGLPSSTVSTITNQYGAGIIWLSILVILYIIWRYQKTIEKNLTFVLIITVLVIALILVLLGFSSIK